VGRLYCERVQAFVSCACLVSDNWCGVGGWFSVKCFGVQVFRPGSPRIGFFWCAVGFVGGLGGLGGVGCVGLVVRGLGEVDIGWGGVALGWWECRGATNC